MSSESLVDTPTHETDPHVLAFQRMFFRVSRDFPASVTALGIFAAQFFSHHPEIPFEELKNEMTKNLHRLGQLEITINHVHDREKQRRFEQGLRPIPFTEMVQVGQVFEMTFAIAEKMRATDFSREKIDELATKTLPELFPLYQEMKHQDPGNFTRIENEFMQRVLGFFLLPDDAKRVRLNPTRQKR